MKSVVLALTLLASASASAVGIVGLKYDERALSVSVSYHFDPRCSTGEVYLSFHSCDGNNPAVCNFDVISPGEDRRECSDETQFENSELSLHEFFRNGIPPGTILRFYGPDESNMSEIEVPEKR